jgi:pimeloyl-ACP methyl ester carboxylesterase/anti-sigma regulatory factor (Ser/Thr protein kinase)
MILGTIGTPIRSTRFLVSGPILHIMSTPPFLDAPEGVGVLAPPDSPLPMLLTTPRAGRGVRGTALLVPGFTGSKEDFIALLGPLADLGWRVAAVDLPGQNGCPALGPRGSNGIEALAAAVESVIQWLSDGAPNHLVGHSLGGLVTQEVVLAQRQPLASWTSVCSGPGALPPQMWPPLIEMREALGRSPMEQIWMRKVAIDRAAAPIGQPALSPRVRQFLHDRFVANDPHALADLAAALMDAADRVDDLRAVIHGSNGPRAAVVTGSLDDAWPVAAQQEMAERLDVPWHLMHGVGHSPAAQAPLATARVLDAIWSQSQPNATGDRHEGSQTSPGKTGVTGMTPGYNPRMAFHATLACDRLAPRTARRAIADFLDANDLGQLSDDAALLTSELVTNAVRHAAGPIQVDAYVQRSQFRLEVADEVPGSGPAPRRAHPNDENGRGMELIDKLAVKWGWHTAGHRKIVWLEMAL